MGDVALIAEIFNNPSSPGGFSGLNQLYNEVIKKNPAITKQQVKEYLETTPTYTRNKPRRVHFPRSKTVAAGFMTDVQCDLGDMQRLARHNRGKRYLLVGIDVLSRRVFLAPVKSKTAKDMKPAFELLFSQMPILPFRIFTDRGLEFKSNAMHSWFNALGIEIAHSSFSSIKAGVAERCIRNVKQRLYRYFGAHHTLNWVDVIGKIADGINNSMCRVTGMPPAAVNFKNARHVWAKVYGNLWKRKRAAVPLYRKDEHVRVTKGKVPFQKGYLPTYSDEVYKVDSSKHSDPLMYKLRDSEDNPTKGYFYKQELSRVRANPDTHHVVENVLKKRTNHGVKELFVKLNDRAKPVWLLESDVIT